MAKTQQLPLNNYATGSYTFTKATPNGLSGFMLEIGRCTTATPTIWPNATTELDIMVIPSFDGGATFDANAKIGFAGAFGGILADPKNGIEHTVTSFGGRFSPQEPTAVRVDIVIRGGPIYSYLDVTVV